MAKDIEENEETLESSSGNRLTDAEYEAMKTSYERGEAGITELSDKYGVSRQAVHRRFKRDGVVKGSKSGVVAAEEIVKSFVDRRSEWIEETRFQGYQALRQTQLIARKIVIDATKAGKPLGAVDDDLRSIGRLNKILCDNVLVSLKVLNADEHIDEGNLPTLTIEDLTDQEVLDHHKATGAMDEDATVEDMLRESLSEDDD